MTQSRQVIITKSPQTCQRDCVCVCVPPPSTPFRISFRRLSQYVRRAYNERCMPLSNCDASEAPAASNSVSQLPQQQHFKAKRHYGVLPYEMHCIRQRRRSFVAHHNVSGSNISRTVRPRITTFYTDIHTDQLYFRTRSLTTSCRLQNLIQYCTKKVRKTGPVGQIVE